MVNSRSERSHWWRSLSSEWKRAYNEAMLGKGPIEESPSDKDIKELFECPNFRFAGPRAFHSNMSLELTDLSGLTEMVQAEMVSVTFHQLTSLSPIKPLTKLTALFMDNNQISSLQGIEAMINLKILVVSANQIDSLIPVVELKNLENLQIAYNRLRSFEGLTEHNTEKMQQFVGLPNRVSQLEIDRIQNELRLRVAKS